MRAASVLVQVARTVFGVDLRSVAVLRIALAALLLADLAYRALDLEAHYTDFGVLPLREATRLGPWSLHFLSGAAGFQTGMFVLAAGCALALGLGWHARAAAFASWLLLASLHGRNPLILTGADEMLRVLLFWSLFLPLSARFSLDARRRSHPAGGSARFVSVGSAALLLQVALVYPVAAIFKRREEVWQQLDFLERAAGVEGVATALGRRLLDVPEILPALSWGALQLETWGVLLAFSPWRSEALRGLAVAVFVAFHAAIGSVLGLGLFPLVMGAAWSVFLPTAFWDRLGVGARPVTGGPEAPPRSRLRHPAVQFVAGCALIAVALQNLDTLAPERGRVLRGPLRALTHALRLDQHWSLWSRVPFNRYYVFPARLADGREVDLHRALLGPGVPLDWERPRRRSRNGHWWKYQLLVSAPAGERLRPTYAGWLRRSWNRGRPPGERVAGLELWMIEAPPGGERRRVPLWRSEAGP